MQNFLKENLNKINIKIRDNEIKEIFHYWDLLMEKNKVLNLIGAKQTEEEKIIVHLLDSLTVKLLNLPSNLRVLDFGSGGGLPAIVLKIINKNWQYTLVESKNKKCNFLNEVINDLKLTNIKVVNEFLNSNKILKNKKYDLITVRAVSSLKNLFNLAASSLKDKGLFLVMKGPNWELEFKEAELELKEHNLRLKQKISLVLPVVNRERVLLLFEKNK